MRLLLILAGLVSLAALTVICHLPLAPEVVPTSGPVEPPAGAGQIPFGFLVPALFTFAVSAFNRPLR